MSELISRRECLAGVLAAAALGTAEEQTSNVDQELRQLAARAPLRMQFQGTTADECTAWQKAFASKLRELLGALQPPSEWQTSVEEAVDFDDHRRESLVLRAKGSRPLPVHLLTPRPAAGRKRPAIVALHGHGRWGNDPVVGIAKTPEAQAEVKQARYDYGLQLVRQGYVVAAPCFTPFGRRLDDEKAYGGQDPCAVTCLRMLELGRLLLAENLRDALWSFEMLARRTTVDPKRIGCVGLSYGGRMTMMTAALEPRIRVAVISGALNLFQERIEGHYSCGAQIIPGLLQWGDVPEIASLIAPRPCLWEVGTRDPLMVKDRIDSGLGRMRRSYRALAAEDRLDVDFFDGEHQWNGAKAYPLLAQHLNPKS